MLMNWSTIGLGASTLLASAVEFVEAFTIVLAMGLTRGWRSALTGTVTAIVLLCGVAAVGGYALTTWFPEALLQLIIGSLLLVFGLQWLRKAILRSSGLKAMHDEDEIFREEAEAARLAPSETKLGLDWFGFVVTFKGVFLEGLEVIFIVITFGLNAHSMPTAIVGAAVGGSIVLIAGFALHKPLARVPENTIKFAVGLLLSTFGTFWAIEGLGYFSTAGGSLGWPGGDAMLLGVLAAWCVFAWLAIRALTPYGKGRTAAPAPLVTKEAA
jgi:Ca2+/H+ antiporter, TMEM165/GDT1 family